MSSRDRERDRHNAMTLSRPGVFVPFKICSHNCAGSVKVPTACPERFLFPAFLTEDIQEKKSFFLPAKVLRKKNAGWILNGYWKEALKVHWLSFV